jgi:outer membrane protein assembly factor BamB
MGSLRSILVLTLASLTYAARAGETPAAPRGFRGDGLGCYPDATPPLEWDGETKKNILWCVPVGPNPFSSPTVAGGRVFLISEPAQLVCVDAETGKILWEKPNGFADLPQPTEEKPARGSAGNVASTPASDGQFVYAVFGAGIVACYDRDGQRRWIVYFDLPQATEFGRSASPVLAEGKLLISTDHLAALDAATGKVLWRSEKVPEAHGTPYVTKIGGVMAVLAPSGHVVRLADGAPLGCLPALKYLSYFVHDSVVYLSGEVSGAFELPARAGDTLELKPLWKSSFEGLFYGSGVCHDGLLYTVCNKGRFRVLDVKSGEVLATQQLEIPSAGSPAGMPRANVYPSITLAGKHLFVSNDRGDTLVLEPGRAYKKVRRNGLDEGSGGTPVFVGRRIYVRGGANLYCLGEK